MGKRDYAISECYIKNWTFHMDTYTTSQELDHPFTPIVTKVHSSPLRCVTYFENDLQLKTVNLKLTSTIFFQVFSLHVICKQTF